MCVTGDATRSEACLPGGPSQLAFEAVPRAPQHPLHAGLECASSLMGNCRRGKKQALQCSVHPLPRRCKDPTEKKSKVWLP